MSFSDIYNNQQINSQQLTQQWLDKHFLFESEISSSRSHLLSPAQITPLLSNFQEELFEGVIQNNCFEKTSQIGVVEEGSDYEFEGCVTNSEFEAYYEAQTVNSFAKTSGTQSPESKPASLPVPVVFISDDYQKLVKTQPSIMERFLNAPLHYNYYDDEYSKDGKTCEDTRALLTENYADMFVDIIDCYLN